MLEISFDDVRDWYRDQIESRSQNYTAGILTLVNKISASLQNLSNSVQEFPTIASEDENALSRTAAEKLTNELNSQINSIEEPKEPFTFHDIDVYIKELSQFLKDSTFFARKYVPKLGRSYRNVVRTTDGFLKSVNKHAVTLHKFHSGFAWLGKAEDVFIKIDAIDEAILKIKETEEKRDRIQKDLNQQKENIEKIENSIEAFKQQTNVSTLRSVESNLKAIKKRAKDNLDVLAKPLEKLTRDGKYTFPGSQGNILYDLVNTPIEYLSKETTKIDDVKTALRSLSKALSSVEINYAKPKIRRALKRIKRVISSGDLEIIKERSQDLLTQKKSVEGKVDFTTEEELQNDLERAKKDFQYTMERMDKVESDKKRIIKRIQNLRKTLNKDIYSAIKEKVNVTF